jgi:predicted transcriptional regulator
MSHVVTTRIDTETLDLVDRAARANGRSRAWFAARAIRRAAEDEIEFLASLDEADSQIDRGEFLSQTEMEMWFETKALARTRRE